MNDLEEQIDLLASGELDKSQTGELVARLDSTPDGWKRCALAFLEDRTWRRALGEMTENLAGLHYPRHEKPATSPSPATESKNRRAIPAPRMLVSAALVIAVMAATFLWGWELGARRHRPDHNLADAPPLVEGSSAPSADSSKIQVVGAVHLDPDGPSPVTAPIVSGEGLDQQWLRGQPPPLSEFELRQFEQQGWLVRQNRKVLSVELDDGKRLTIPIDAMHYQFIGQNVY